MREFDKTEINGVIKQLEKSIGAPLELALRRRLVESSQGFPWLTKKLCIHTLKQINSGKTIENLIEQELNCEFLFKEDTEGLNPNEIKALKYIAKRSFEGDSFDGIEVDEKIDELVISGLINKRLVVKSGTKYNVYWDIFRDYLVTDKVPYIGESYIIRQDVKACLDVYLLFNERNKLSLEECHDLHPRHSGTSTLWNILRELQSIGLLRKLDEQYCLHYPEIDVTEEGFKSYITEKFKKYTPFLKLQELPNAPLTITDIVDILKKTFKGISFNENTWRTYAKYLVNWFKFSNYDFKNKLKDISSRQVRSMTNIGFIPQKRPKQDLELIRYIVDDNPIPNNKKWTHSIYDLQKIGFVHYRNKKISLTEKGNYLKQLKNTEKYNKFIAEQALQVEKIRQAYIAYSKDQKRISFCKEVEFLVKTGISKQYKQFTKNILYAWAEFIYNELNVMQKGEALKFSTQ